MGLVVALIAALFIATGGGGIVITDPAGDSGTAPDITGLDVGVDGNGLATFKVDVPLPTSDTASTVYVYIDADNNPGTGSPIESGADYVFAHYQSDLTYDFYAWNSTAHDFDSVSDFSTISAKHDTSGVTFVINRSRLSNASQINVFARSVPSENPNDTHFDRAPNGGTTSFDLTPFTLDVVAFHAGTVKAGGRLTITMAAKQSDNGTYADTVTCKLTSGSTSLHALMSTVLTVNGVPTGTCIWSIAKKLKGKTLHPSITESSQGRSVTKTAVVKAH